jgi:trimethylamine--corrinoid protein Co-methyltransferase
VQQLDPRHFELVRNFPPLQVLGDEGLALIEANADTLLQEVGMQFRGDPEVIEILKAAGVDVQGERARFALGQCRRIIRATAPREFVQHARNPQHSVRIGGRSTVLAPAGGAPFVHDLDGGRRPATLRDLHNLIKLAQGVPSLHNAGGFLVTLVDQPVQDRHLHFIDAQFRYSDKVIIGASDSAASAADTVRMAEQVFGERRVADHCVIYAGINTNSPLMLDVAMTSVMKVYARANQAVTVSPYVLAGSTGPVGLAGVLAQQLAEAMAGLALYQLLRRGAPCTMGTYIGAISMQTGAPAFGTPESLLGMCAAAELARRLGVPVNSAGGAVTSACLPDAQAAQESALTLQASVLAGANIIWHCAGWLEGGLVASYEKLLLDAELCSVMANVARGIDLSPEGQAMDALRAAKPGGHFLASAHTKRNFRTALWRSVLMDARTQEQWAAAGGLDAARRANVLWKRRLADYQQPPLDPAIGAALADFKERRLRELRGR